MAVLEDAHLGRERVDLDITSACRVGNAVGIAPDADHTVPGDPPLQPQHRSEGGEWKRPQGRPFLGEGLVDDASRGGVHPWIGDDLQPVAQLDGSKNLAL